MRPIGIDLFAGAGGMSLGFEQAGFDIIGAVEIDPIHSSVHEFNFPECKVFCTDVSKIQSAKILHDLNISKGDLDVVFGGAPCQGFSLIGKRAIDDPRNSLVFHFVRLVKELKPKYFVFENVKGLTIGKHRAFLEEIIAALQNCGYNLLLPYKVLTASDYGVPQDRKRLLLVGARKDQELPTYPMPHSDQITVGDAILDIPNLDDFEELIYSDSVQIKWKAKSRYAKIMHGEATDPNDYSYPRKYSKSFLTSSTRTEHTDESIRRFLLTEPGSVESISRFKKLDSDGLCNTLRAGTDSARGAFTSPRPIHPVFPRVISVREAARLHSYPDWFRFHATKWHGFRQIGNSVPPKLARAVASEIIKSLNILPEKPESMLELGDVNLLQCDMKSAAEYFDVSRKIIPQRTRKVA
jgi:DNA (cytosine-5)-methyltransferase 1